MPLILPGNVGSATAASGFDVSNSCRFNRADSADMTLSMSSGGSQTKFTKSFWVKRCTVGEQHYIYDNSGTTQIFFHFRDSDKIGLGIFNSGAYSTELISTQLFRDVSAWYHFVIAVDYTNGTQAHRARIYVNGTEITAFDTGTRPGNDSTTFDTFNSDKTHYIGSNASSNHYLHGYLAEVVHIDNAQLAPDQFGEFDEDTGIWKPIDVSGLTFGTKGYYLDYKASGNLGNDANGGTDWTENNFAATDQSIDTCTNNFCTMNPLIPTTNATFSEGNCKLAIGGSSIQGAGIGTFGLTAGKWYWEVKLLADKDNHTHGVISELTAELNANVTAIQNDVGVTSWINGDGGEVVVDGSATTADYGIMAENSIMGIALDIDNYNISYYNNGSASVTDFNMSTTRGTIFPLIKMGINCTAEVNFGGCSAFAVSSGNTDGNGFGNFEHAPPSGYFAICSKNLAENG